MNALQKWLKQEESRKMEEAARAKPPFFNTFDEYVQTYPEGEHFRRMVHNGVLLAGYEGPCVPGGYYIAFITSYKEIIEVVVNDGDDGYMRKPCNTKAEAQQTIENLKLLAPFEASELKGFGFENG